MDTKQIKDIPNSTFSLYQKAIQSFKLNNIDYAIELMKTTVLREPGFLEARRELRKMEIAKSRPGLFKHALTSLKQNKLIKIAQMKIAMKKYWEAYVFVEGALAINIHNTTAIKLLAEIGRDTESDFMVIEAYDYAVMLFHKNVDILKQAAEAYREYKLPKKEVETRKKIVALKPDDLKARMELREASALETMEKSNWENSETDYRDKLKSEQESKELEANEKIAKEEDEVSALINHYKEELKANPDSVKALRELGNIYLNVGQFDEAQKAFTSLMQNKGTFDLSIDKSIEKAKVKKILAEINVLNENLNDSNSAEINEKINEKNAEILKIQKEHSENRIKIFPNDMQIRFNLGKIYWGENNLDAAIEQFQLSRASLNKKIPSIIFLGICFMEKGQFDIASEQFLKVLKEEEISTELTFKALYNLGKCYEKLDKREEAATCFKKIYSEKSTYEDVAEIIKKYY